MRVLPLAFALLATPALAADSADKAGAAVAPSFHPPMRRFEAVPREPGRIGIGIGGGTRTTGLSLKATVDENLSLQLVAGVDSGATNDRGGTLALSGSVLVEMPAIVEDEDYEIGWCVGAGPYIAVGDQFWLGAHAIAGLEINLRVIPLEFQLEYRPSLELIGPDEVDLVLVDFGGHLRWWF